MMELMEGANFTFENRGFRKVCRGECAMYKRAARGWLKHFDFMLIDFVCLEISLMIAYNLRQGGGSPLHAPLYRNMAVTLFLIEILVVFFFESLKNILKRGTYKEFEVMVKHVCLTMLLSSFYLFLIQSGTEYSRMILIVTGGIYLVLGYIARLIWKRFLLSRNVLDGRRRSLLIVTAESMMDAVLGDIKNNNYEGFYIAGVVVLDKDMVGKVAKGVKIVANATNVTDYVCREWVDEVFINLPGEMPLCECLIEQFVEMGVAVHLKLAKVSSFSGQKQLVEQLGNYTVLTTCVNVATNRQMFLKRMLDICGGIVGCIATGILFLFVAPCIYIKSPGPIFFSQVRVGKNGKKFKINKFRSMYLDAEERKKELLEKNRISGGMMFKLGYDPRIIGSERGQGKGIGNFIRKHSIDEFPQFYNVLNGEMSLVGTRPPTVDEWEKYDLHHRARLAIKPGITGMWQVSGRSNITDFEEVVALDRKYITEWSMGVDLKILLKTVLVVFRRDGAM